MMLHELMDKVIGSRREDWHKITCWGANSGPSYHVRATHWHTNVAVYLPDPSITLAFGLDDLEDFEEEWANKFADPHASSYYVDVFYNNALVFRDLYVTVDGGHAYLPLPARKFDDEKRKVVALEVPERQHHFIRLVNLLAGSCDFDRYFGDAGFRITGEAWPNFGCD